VVVTLGPRWSHNTIRQLLSLQQVCSYSRWSHVLFMLLMTDIEQASMVLVATEVWMVLAELKVIALPWAGRSNKYARSESKGSRHAVNSKIEAMWENTVIKWCRASCRNSS
jgi:hypothetical protein